MVILSVFGKIDPESTPTIPASEIRIIHPVFFVRKIIG